MAQTDLLQLLIKPVEGCGSKEDFQKQSDLLPKQLVPVSWKGQADKNLDSEKLLQCKKALSGGKKKKIQWKYSWEKRSLVSEENNVVVLQCYFRKLPVEGLFCRVGAGKLLMPLKENVEEGFKQDAKSSKRNSLQNN